MSSIFVPFFISFFLIVAGCRIEKRISEVSLEKSAGAVFNWQPKPKSSSWKRIESYAEISRFITPTERSSLAGYGGLDRRLFPPRLFQGSDPSVYCRPFEEIESNPRVKISLFTGSPVQSAADDQAIEGGMTDAFIIVNLDLVAVTQDVTEWLLRSAREALGDLTQLDHANFQVIATHTHSGPSGLSLSPLWGAFACDTYHKNYRDSIEVTFKDALLEAWNKRSSVSTIEVNEADVPGFNESRFEKMSVDTSVYTLRIRGAENEPLGCQFSYPVHSTHYGPKSLKMSTDLAGQLEGSVAAALEFKDCFFMNGVSGNARAKMDGATPKEYSQKIANKLREALESQSSRETNPEIRDQNLAFSYGALPLALPRPRFNFAGCGVGNLEAAVGLPILNDLPGNSKTAFMKIGNETFVYIPGEILFTSAQLIREKLKSLLPVQSRVHFIATANDYTGYILPMADYNTRALESCSSLYGESFAEKLGANLFELFQQL